MHRTFLGFVAAASVLAAGPVVHGQGAAQKERPPAKVDTVAAVGCLRESPPGTWMLVNASEPVASTANAPPPKELAALPRGGKHEFRLIGVSIFNLPAHRDHTVVVKGLHIKDPKVSRLNVTSVTTVAGVCPPPAAR